MTAPFRTRVLIVSAAVLLAAGAGRAANGPLTPYQNIPLWAPGQVPLATGDGPLDNPFMTAFLPPEGARNGTSVIIGPGGGNVMLMYGGEGMEVAERYNEWGVTAFVLTYRLNPYGQNARVADVRRAIQVVRANAAAWNLDPARIGYIGFSAGSSIGRAATATAVPGDPNAADPIDRVSSRPDYLGLIYGPGGGSPNESLKDFPPTFLLSAAADTGPSNSNAQLFLDLNRAGATAEIHIYQKGRHGFGASFRSPEFGEWMPTLKHFLVVGGLLPEAK